MISEANSPQLTRRALHKLWEEQCLRWLKHGEREIHERDIFGYVIGRSSCKCEMRIWNSVAGAPPVIPKQICPRAALKGY